MTGLSIAMEQYLETIYAIEKEGSVASVSDIAEARGVKAPSVTYVLRKLSSPELDLVNYEKYNREVTLTQKGRRIAQKLERTHETLRWFFESIGLDHKIADEDACELEHIVRPETVEKLIQFAAWVKETPRATKWLADFREQQKA